MRKILSFVCVLAGLFLTTAYAEAHTPVLNLYSLPACVRLEHNLSVGSRDGSSGIDLEVKALQNALRSTKHFNAESTGYFGNLTLRAVKDFQRANGLPSTGFVGILTRAKINSMICLERPQQPPVATSSIQVIAPKGGETWVYNTIQKIQWTDSNTYIQEPKYDIKLQLDLDCRPNQPCILLYPIPVAIAKNVSNASGFSWTVGSTTSTTSMVSNGKYRVFVCPAGNPNPEDLNGCGKSASYVTITGAY